MSITKIDLHTHIMPEHTPNWFKKFGYGDFVHLEHHKPCCARMIKGDQVFREIKNNAWDPEVRIEDMNEESVSMQVLSTIPVLFNYWANPEDANDTSRFFNDHIASVVDLYPDRFIGLGTVPLQDVDLAIREMERVKKDLKMPGLQIGSNVNNLNLSDPVFDAFWEAAEAMDVSIFVHPWQMMGFHLMRKYWLPWLVGMPAETSRAITSLIFGGVMEKYPKLRFAFAHGGGSFPATIGRVEHGFNCRPDLVAIDNPHNPRKYLNKFWIDSLVHDPVALEFIIKVMGEDKICMGSDYPFPLGEWQPGKLIEETILNDHVKKKLLVDNVLDFLNMKL